MKQIHSTIMMLAMITVAAFSFSSCSSDDEDDFGSDSKKDKVTVEYEGATVPVHTYSVTDATYEYLYQLVEGTTKIDSTDGITFSVTLTDNDGFFTYWQFQTQDEIKKGASLSVDCIFWNMDPRSAMDSEGDVIVKSVSSNKITLSFKDFEFYRYISFDSNKKQKLTINGEITFELED